MRPGTGAIALLALLGTAAAKTGDPQELYVAGNYQTAIDAGVAQGTASSFAVAAHAALANATIHAPCLDCIARAEGLARRAIALDPRLPEGHLYFAVALGYEARIRGAVVARMKGLVEEAKTNLDAHSRPIRTMRACWPHWADGKSQSSAKAAPRWGAGFTGQASTKG